MTKSGSKYIKIKIDTDTGTVVKVTDEHGNKATQLDPAQVQEIYQSKNGFKYVCEVLHAHSSPGCIYINLGGWWFRICR